MAEVPATGDSWADRYCDRAYRGALSVCCDDDRAQDAVQEAFLCVWKSGGSSRPQQDTVGAWLVTAVRQRAIDLARATETTPLDESATVSCGIPCAR
jgi:DNA-directed RNA polymerase specialized sigma24 family protein